MIKSSLFQTRLLIDSNEGPFTIFNVFCCLASGNSEEQLDREFARLLLSQQLLYVENKLHHYNQYKIADRPNLSFQMQKELLF